ncbi:MAG: hypothetical protein WCX73_00910 [Candidatus Pacearchaeota archaeon]|jgi:hypothetical protein
MKKLKPIENIVNEKFRSGDIILIKGNFEGGGPYKYVGFFWGSGEGNMHHPEILALNNIDSVIHDFVIHDSPNPDHLNKDNFLILEVKDYNHRDVKTKLLATHYQILQRGPKPIPRKDTSTFTGFG